MMRAVYEILVFCPILCFQSFSLEILSHFDLKLFFLSPKLAELYFFSANKSVNHVLTEVYGKDLKLYNNIDDAVLCLITY